jgi:hypothetical protein
LRDAVAFLKKRCPDAEVIAAWMDADWRVHEIGPPLPRG